MFTVAHPSNGCLGRVSRFALRGRGRAWKIVAALFYMFDMLVSVGRLRHLRKEYQVVIFVRYLMGTAYLPTRLAPIGYDLFWKLLPTPNRLLLVDIDPAVALERILERDGEREMFENLDSLIRVRNTVLRLASDEWEIMDNSGDRENARSGLMEIIDRWERQESQRLS